jgi:hypothetical protein
MRAVEVKPALKAWHSSRPQHDDTESVYVLHLIYSQMRRSAY